jgi:tetratricopeptide (TPR) repeat protein
VAQSSDDVVTLWRHGLIEESGHERLTIHQAVFDYARLLLTDAAAYRRLARYLTELANDSRYHSTKRDWLEELEEEHDNFRAALDWTIHAADAEAGVALAGALWPFWYERSYLTEGRHYIDQLLQLPGSDSPDLTIGRAKIINDSANLAYNQGDIVIAERLHREALELRTAAHDPAISGTWNNLGILARCRREYAQADTFFRDAAAANEQIWRAEPDTDLGKERRLWHGNNLDNLGVSLTEQGRLEEARTAFEESVMRFTEVKSEWGVAMANSDLGQVCVLENESDGALRLWVESLGTQHRNQNLRDAAATLRRLGRELPEAVPSSLAVAALRAALRISNDIGDNAGIAGALERLAPTLPPRDAAAALACAAAYRETSGYLGPQRDADSADQFTQELREKLREEFESARAAGANERPIAFAAKLAEEWQVSLDEVVTTFEALPVERSAS